MSTTMQYDRRVHATILQLYAQFLNDQKPEYFSLHQTRLATDCATCSNCAAVA